MPVFWHFHLHLRIGEDDSPSMSDVIVNDVREMNCVNSYATIKTLVQNWQTSSFFFIFIQNAHA